MDEMTGTAHALEALGNTIAQLKKDLSFEVMCKENAEYRISQLQAENERLLNKLNAVEAYISKEVG